MMPAGDQQQQPQPQGHASPAHMGGVLPQHANTQAQMNGAEFFLSNYRLWKTLGIGSFGKVKVA